MAGPNENNRPDTVDAVETGGEIVDSFSEDGVIEFIGESAGQVGEVIGGILEIAAIDI